MVGNNRTPVTVIGLGSMGRALAEAFIEAGHPTTVWNRSPEKAAPLVAKGAVHVEAIAEAVAEGHRDHSVSSLVELLRKPEQN